MRFQDTLFVSGVLPRGVRNMITDVAGVRVGHLTKREGDGVRTGLTLIDPTAPDLFLHPLPAAIDIANGTGKMAGISEVEELGILRAPIALTNTHAVGAVMCGVIDLILRRTPEIPFYGSVNAVVGEVNDSILNDLHQCSIVSEDVAETERNLTYEVEVGCVGAGTGTRAFSWKGGIGTSSRIVVAKKTTYTIGVLVQTNYGGQLRMMGVPIGRMLGEKDSIIHPIFQQDGSCMIVLATDAPLSARQLKRLARRCFLGLARTGSVIPTSSGDYAIAFSTSRAGCEGIGELGKCLPDDMLNQFFLAAVEATEESVYDALFAAKTTTGNGGRILEALPVDRVISILKKSLATFL